MDNNFIPVELTHGERYSNENVSVSAFVGRRIEHFTEGTYFVFVVRGVAFHNSEFMLRTGMYGCFNSGHLTTEDNSKVFVIQEKNYNGMRQFGGPIENEGRLRYIDGCTDSLLVPPVKMGDPCLNHLHFPKEIEQTMHVHPSIRVGVVYRGEGECVTPIGTHPLKAGTGFVIPTAGQHCFKTTTSMMDVIAWHPDSDFGPTDYDHPMINRTIIGGVSAKHLTEIQTK